MRDRKVLCVVCKTLLFKLGRVEWWKFGGTFFTDQLIRFSDEVTTVKGTGDKLSMTNQKAYKELLVLEMYLINDYT